MMSSNNATAVPFRIPDLIRKKRNGLELTKEEIDFFIKTICDRNNNLVQESQIGAMLMAIYFRSMTYEETYLFTSSMMKSGDRFSWPQYRNRVVDKHCTGGVGDKISLLLAPALAVCGLKVPMISGRGLGHTGGTLDKLESIPGYQVSCSKSKVESLIREIGCCIVGQTSELNPADRVLYSTRDITSTVECVPLIAGSIVSKKAIEDLDALVLDIKIGKATLIRSINDAELLAEYMLEISKRLGIKAGVFLTQHDDPLGYCVGNQLEVEETIEGLYGNLSPDIEELVTKYGGYLLQRVKIANTMKDGQRIILEKLKNGEALAKFRDMIVGQGVSKEIANELCNRNYDVFPAKAKYLSTIKAKDTGYIKSIDALLLGNICCRLGGGRCVADDIISYEVGFRLLKKTGERIEFNEPWLQVLHNSVDFEEKYAQSLIDSIEITNEPVKAQSSIIKILDFD